MDQRTDNDWVGCDLDSVLTARNFIRLDLAATGLSVSRSVKGWSV